MSKENIVLFYQHLEANITLQEQAMSLQMKYPEQEKCIEAFIELAEKAGFPFTFREFVEHLYAQAEEIEKK